MIMPLVKLLQLLVSERRNRGRIAAGIIAISGVRIERVEQRSPHHLIWRGHRAFHLIIHHAFIDQSVVLNFKPMSFLLEIQFFQLRKERGIQIHIHQIVIIFSVLGAKRIHSPIRSSERIHKRIQTALDHGKKRIADRKFFRAA